MPLKNRIQLRDYLRYQLSQLSAKNAFHEFEHLSFEIARLRVAPNLLPATGPVQAGGDQGRDFESYRSYIASSPIGSSGFVACASDEMIVGACSLQKDIIPKIRGDLATVFGSGTRPDAVLYFCEQNVAVATRHALQRECLENYGARLEIFDGTSISDLLADRDTFWIAEQYLNVPADEWPEEPVDEVYGGLRSKWLNAGAKPGNYADFLEIKEGLRTATFEEEARPDLSRWINLMRGLLSEDIGDRFLQKARYEVAVAELRGKGSLDPATDLVTQFFENISPQTNAAQLLDAAVLSVYAWGAFQHGQTSLALERINDWKSCVESIIDKLLADESIRVDLMHAS